MIAILAQIAFQMPALALTAQVNCAYAYAAASHADAWLAEHFQKQNALVQMIAHIHTDVQPHAQQTAHPAKNTCKIFIS
ncbi:hypothetical protein V6C53_04220 [Desulfocurvibacter africanus]|uniref:hypothetical protein n=1 Tax=Desulfocurvibacter africanus TaxID=873 RepID=UPI002FD8C202